VVWLLLNNWGSKFWNTHLILEKKECPFLSWEEGFEVWWYFCFWGIWWHPGVNKSPMNETEVEISWALLLNTWYPQCANELRKIMVWVWYKDFEGPNRRRSSTYRMNLLGKRLRELRFCYRAWPKKWGISESLNPWGRTVQVNCWVSMWRQIRVGKRDVRESERRCSWDPGLKRKRFEEECGREEYMG
jgi:hypothetical protein